jgi:hypothetical protein
MLAAVVILVLYHKKIPPDGQVDDFYALANAFTGRGPGPTCGAVPRQ